MSHFNSNLCDTPVACVCELNKNNQYLSSTYIFYDFATDMYCLRGRVGTREPVYYSYDCTRPGTIYDYFKFVTDEQNSKFSYNLINAAFLPTESRNIDFLTLEQHNSKWISAYDEDKACHKKLKQLLSIVKGFCYKDAATQYVDVDEDYSM